MAGAGTETRLATIETLDRMTSRLADANLTLAEASALRPEIERLLEQVQQASGPAPAVWCDNARGGR
jgi:hypothetical protein